MARVQGDLHSHVWGISKLFKIPGRVRFFSNEETISNTVSYFHVGCPRGVIVKAIDCGIVDCEFVFQSRHYVHSRANTLGKVLNPLILPSIGGKRGFIPVQLLFFYENIFGIK